MNAKYFAALTTIILAMGLSQPVTQAQSKESVVASMLNEIGVQHAPKSQSQQKASEPPAPPERGAPGDRKGGATHNSNILQ